MSNSELTYLQCLENENKIKLLESYKGAKTQTKMQCLVCDHVWIATPLSKRQTYKKYGVGGCPKCNIQKKNNKYKIIRDKAIKKLTDRGIEILDLTYDGRLRLDYNQPLKNEKVLVRNNQCGHEFYVTPLNLLQSNVECGICGPTKRTAKLTAWSKANSTEWRKTATAWQAYKAEVSSLTRQTYRKHKQQINPNNLLRDKAGVDGAYHLDHIVPKRFCFDNDIPASICAHHSNLQMIGWKENVGSRNHIKGTIPPMFFQYISTNSKLEQYAAQLKTIFPDCQTFVNIADVMITAYDQKSNRAIIVLPLDKAYANMKSGLMASKALTAANIPFIILFEDEMEDNTLLTAKLKHYTSDGTSTRIHARQCEIKICGNDEKRKLLNANHVQGSDNAHINYGAYYQDKLVAVMTFSKPRVALGQKKQATNQGRWELVRFCTDVNYRIPGIASKLLTHFKRNHDWTEIYSYADKRWSTGNMYHQLGFTLIADNPPDYFYIIDGIRKHRWNYRKDILKTKLSNYDPELTEYENMVNNGYWRIWDCGTLKFQMKNSLS